MAEGYQSLTEKEKETLRLILHGHDAKSMACQLDLSVHTINERLRTARRKLEVTSSKEAARLLLEQEGDLPNFLGHKLLGEAGAGASAPDKPPPKARIRRAWIIGGSLVMSLILATIALISLSPNGGTATSAALAADQAADSPSAPAADVAAAARDFLVLIDKGDWDASWAATASAFQSLNTRDAWAAASVEARGPLGDIISRVLVSQDSVPAPPRGYQLVKFRANFTNRTDVVETVTLVREDNSWKVVGITVS